MKKPVFNIGDKIRVIIPETVSRIGYNLSLTDVYDEIGKHDSRIQSFLLDVDAPWYDNKVMGVVEEGIRKALAYGILSKRNFGGPERKIHVNKDNEFLGRIAKVMNKKIVRTGKYNKGSYGNEGDDFTPAYLSNIKSHVLLLVSFIDKNYGSVWIEAKNIELFL